MIRKIITTTALLYSFYAGAQDEGTPGQAQFGGRTCDIQRGICAFGTGTNRSSSSTTMKNFTTYKQSANSIMIELEAGNMSVEDQKRIFGKEYSQITADETLTFMQEDDFAFSVESLILLDLDINYKLLKKGNYPINILNDKVQVTLTLSRE